MSLTKWTLFDLKVRISFTHITILHGNIMGDLLGFILSTLNV